jgi:hypothetical protein
MGMSNTAIREKSGKESRKLSKNTRREAAGIISVSE